jgi:hypothetical protein
MRLLDEGAVRYRRVGGRKWRELDVDRGKSGPGVGRRWIKTVIGIGVGL